MGDRISIRFGPKELQVEVLSVQDNVGKADAAAMYREVSADKPDIKTKTLHTLVKTVYGRSVFMAYELKQAAELSQRIDLTGRERLTVTGVEDGSGLTS